MNYFDLDVVIVGTHAFVKHDIAHYYCETCGIMATIDHWDHDWYFLETNDVPGGLNGKAAREVSCNEVSLIVALE